MSDIGVVITQYLPGKGQVIEDFVEFDDYDKAKSYKNGVNDGLEMGAQDHLSCLVLPQQLEYLEDSIKDQLKDRVDNID